MIQRSGRGGSGSCAQAQEDRGRDAREDPGASYHGKAMDIGFWQPLFEISKAVAQKGDKIVTRMVHFGMRERVISHKHGGY